MSLELSSTDPGAMQCLWLWLYVVKAIASTPPCMEGPAVRRGAGRVLRAVFSSSPNFYILDEPTNHLDMETIEALAKALNKFRVRLGSRDVPFF